MLQSGTGPLPVSLLFSAASFDYKGGGLDQGKKDNQLESANINHEYSPCL